MDDAYRDACIDAARSLVQELPRFGSGRPANCSEELWASLTYDEKRFVVWHELMHFIFERERTHG